MTDAARAELFRRVRAAPGYQDAMAWTPASRGATHDAVVGMQFGLGFMAFFSVIGGICLVSAAKMPWFFLAVPVLLFTVGACIFVGSAVQWLRYRRAPLERYPARVVAKRAQLPETADSTGRHFYVALETEDGRRREHATPQEVFDAATEGDVGVACVRGGRLNGLRRLGATRVPAADARPPAEERRERFRRVIESRGHEALLAWRPDTSAASKEDAGTAVALLVFAGLAGTSAFGFFQAPARPSQGVPLGVLAACAFAAFGLAGSVYSAAKWLRRRGAPMEAFTALVFAKRIHVRERAAGEKSNRSRRADFFVALESVDGTRREVRAAPEIYGIVIDGETGVAYVRHDELLDFRAVDG